MAQQGPIVVYGATGYTGTLVAHELRRRRFARAARRRRRGDLVRRPVRPLRRADRARSCGDGHPLRRHDRRAAVHAAAAGALRQPGACRQRCPRAGNGLRLRPRRPARAPDRAGRRAAQRAPARLRPAGRTADARHAAQRAGDAGGAERPLRGRGLAPGTAALAACALRLPRTGRRAAGDALPVGRVADRAPPRPHAQGHLLDHRRDVRGHAEGCTVDARDGSGARVDAALSARGHARAAARALPRGPVRVLAREGQIHDRRARARRGRPHPPRRRNRRRRLRAHGCDRGPRRRPDGRAGLQPRRGAVSRQRIRRASLPRRARPARRGVRDRLKAPGEHAFPANRSAADAPERLWPNGQGAASMGRPTLRRPGAREETRLSEVQAEQRGDGAPAPAVSANGLRKVYGDVVALERLSLDVWPGEFFTMLGPSSSGKTTTLRLIAGFERPDAGAIALDGLDVTGQPPYQRDVNTVFQDYALFPHMTIGENVAYGLMVKGVGRKERAARAEEALRLVQLGELAKRKPIQLSGGQRQRVALARALVNRPRVLLLDEPLGALDLKLRQDMQLELKRIQRELSEGVTFIYVTHDQDEALMMSDRIAVFSTGRIEQIGTPREIYERPANEFVAGFVGTSNIVERDGRRCTVRPEKIRLLAEDETVRDGELSELGAVREVIYLGSATRYVVALDDGGTLVAMRQNDESGDAAASEERGRRVRLAWRAQHMTAVGSAAEAQRQHEEVPQ